MRASKAGAPCLPHGAPDSPCAGREDAGPSLPSCAFAEDKRLAMTWRSRVEADALLKIAQRLSHQLLAERRGQIASCALHDAS